MEVVGCIWDAYWNYSPKGKIVALPAMMIMKHSVKDASHAIYVSQEFLQSRYPCKGKSIGVSDVELQEMDEVVLDKRLVKIREESSKIIIGTTAAINVPYKGQEYVIRALSEIRKRTDKEVEYHLVGGGESDRLKKVAWDCGVEEYVKFIGVLSHDKVFEFLDGIDVYAQPSRQEGLCRALVEAMSRGLPCVASKVGGNPELLNKEFIFSMKGEEAVVQRVADAVCKIVEQKTMLNEAERNFRHAKKYFERYSLEKKRNDFFRDFIDNEVKPCLK